MKKVVMLFCGLLLLTGCGKEVKKEKKPKSQNDEVKIEEKVDIIDLESNSRPYAVVINNYPDAVRVQSGLNEAYIVYEFPIEGGMSRSLALYKDKQDVKIGTVRSARHNYIDYILENDAIFVHFGWSHEAETQIVQMGIENIDGNYMDPKPFWRENPEGLATEHTVYTNLSNIIDYNNTVKKYRTTTEKDVLLNYVPTDVDFSKYEDSKEANEVMLTYGYSYNVKFVYNSETHKYDRYVNGNVHKDYFSGEKYDTKNIIVVLLDWGVLKAHKDAAGSNYLDLYNVGSGNGYYITNGKALPITWKKDSREGQTKYLYGDKEIEINDGNTYIMFNNNNNLSIK